ncbi:MAG: NAD-dependent epimerase/dehydratase family protein [Gammaproteobacteria bacterium]|nr:NAD-dependent epimerase/dehydratase family protein [Gammaproteobacteria bacterium]MCP5202358.1 NAD-dependent epimerase/dehydratase family protein [Gammaproteobacteria bacterium]
MSILVTGATGFLGSAVARALVAAGEEVRVLTRAGTDPANIAGLDVEVCHGDLLDAASLARACAGCRALYHVAADYRLWVRDPAVLYRVNVDGTRALMEAALAAGIERIVYTSSVATLGLHADGRPADEDTPVTLAAMVGHYKRSKFLAERAVDELVSTRGLPAVIVNPSTPIGPRDIKPTPTGRIVRDAALGRIPAYVDTGLNVAHVDDVAAGHLLAFARGEVGRRYILGGDNLALKDILGVVAEWCGRPPPRIRLPRRAVYPVAWVAEAWARLTDGPEPQATVDGLRMAKKKMYFDCARARRELGYTSRPARAAIVDALAWFEARGMLARR